MDSIISFPIRGNGGDASYPGNAGPGTYHVLYDVTQPETASNLFSGSGTAGDVAKERGIKWRGFDLRDGFDAVRMDLLSAQGYEADVTSSHPPYWLLKKYSGNPKAWGDKPHPADLSHVEDLDDFYDLLHATLLNQRRATKNGGHYAMLIGDVCRNEDGERRYYSLQAEMLCRMSRDEHMSMVIKAQHNVSSGKRTYSTRYRLTGHEYLIIWRKADKSVHALFEDLYKAQVRRSRGTWKALVISSLRDLGGVAPLGDLYGHIAEEAPEKVRGNGHYKAKVRQTLNTDPFFASDERGVWRFA